ncbi:SGNH/GDSL hydrolase family protein [Paludisphaera rhizosphaerae]|uniref:SGNH/GDSL hydrolase family protein n=1 Tax=Paludisphaera rhizosphaerae TaxID=2711216 RepID=UPI0013EB9B12|nr:SGNH/GDSL hydrolase family protein [Paludisphaera rhizosphaerae]
MDGTKRSAWIWVIGSALIAGLTLGDEAVAGPYTGLIVFGDSLSDVGNTYAAAGMPPAPYYGGRYSNGPIWVEYLAQKLGIAAPTPSYLGGTDYAWGFAQSSGGFTYPPEAGGAGVPNLLTQIGGFVQAGGTLDSTKLVSIWAGANDFLNNGVTDYNQVADNIVTAITSLAAVGGTQFLVGGLPLLGTLPATLSQPPQVQALLNQLTLAFNMTLEAKLQALEMSHPSLHIFFNDVNSEFQKIVADPSVYGLTNVTGSALADGVYDGKGYLFWDGVHPTTAVHELIAQMAFQEVVPEPSSLVLAAISGVTVLVASRLRRAA